MSVIDDLIRLAQESHIDPRLFLSVAQVESNFNPGAIGDQGTSFGLFQLHRGGQAPSNYSNQQLLNPTTNANLAIPGIKEGLKVAGPFQNTASWWQTFASASGHPGGSLAQASSEASKLQYAYNGNSFDAPSTGSVTTSTDTAGLSGLGSFISDIGLELLVLFIALVIIVVAIYFFVR